MASAASILEEIRRSRPAPGNDVVRAPGDRARSSIALGDIAEESVEIPVVVLDALGELAEGSTGSMSGDHRFN